MLANQTIAFMSDLLLTDEWSTQIPGARETMRHTYHREQPLETTAREIVGKGTKPMLASLCAAGLMGAAPAAHHRATQTHTVKPAKVHHKVKGKTHRKRVKFRVKRGPWVPKDTYSGPIDESPMAVTTYMEARNQPRSGRIAVMNVIKNRVAADKKMFGLGLRGVCHHPWQYSAWNRNDDSQRVAYFNMLQLPEDHPEKKLWRSIQKDAKEVWSGKIKDNTGGATYYHTPAVFPRWRLKMHVTGIVGDHIFYRPMTPHERKLDARDSKANRQLTQARRVARRAHKKPVHIAVSIRYHNRVVQEVPKVTVRHRR